MLVPEFIARDKRILVRANVVITVGPILDAAAPIKARFGRQRRPADVILVRAPRDPGWRPLIARHPNPADAFQPHPAPVMISRPAERFVRNPGPTGVAINPAPFGVRTPVARLFRLARLPDVAVIVRLAPFAVGIELLIKHSVGSGGSFFRAGFSSFADHRGSGRDSGWLRHNGIGCGFLVRDSFFPLLDVSLLLRETLLLRVQAFGSETILHLPLDLGLSFLFGLLFLAGNEKRQGGDQRENGKLLHGLFRQGHYRVIRTKTHSCS
ncbi:MAG: hypothetical protein QOI49_934 [Verrucomicrobiota bacterium]